MNWESVPVLDNHLHQRRLWEERSRDAFYGTDDEAHLLATFVLEALAQFSEDISGQRWPNEDHGRYYVGLVVSFIRTHFLVVQCAERSNLIEGATLLRKQLEVVARLRELDALEDAEVPAKKPPNVKALKSKIKGLYGPLSEVAHSSVSDHFQVMGTGELNGTRGWTRIYPDFSRHAYVALYQAGHVFLEFWLWVFEFNERHGQPWDLSEFNASGNAAFRVMKQWDPYREMDLPDQAVEPDLGDS